MIYDFVLAETLFMSIKVFYVTLQKIPTLHTPLQETETAGGPCRPSLDAS